MCLQKGKTVLSSKLLWYVVSGVQLAPSFAHTQGHIQGHDQDPTHLTLKEGEEREVGHQVLEHPVHIIMETGHIQGQVGGSPEVHHLPALILFQSLRVDVT